MAYASGLPLAASAFDPASLSFPDFSGMQSIPLMGSASPSVYPMGGSTGIPVPGAGGLGTGLGMNLGTAQLALGGLQTLGNLWSSFQANKLAKSAFNFQKGMSNTNLNNSIASYNTQLGDKINTRAFVEGLSPDQAKAYLASNSLSRSGFKDPKNLTGG